MWHHELELPKGFEETYPETLNKDGDIEISHPIVREFLENKIKDFFNTYTEQVLLSFVGDCYCDSSDNGETVSEVLKLLTNITFLLPSYQKA